MDNTHVEKLFYRVVTPDHIDYDKAHPISGETNDFCWNLSKDQLEIEMKIHCRTEEEAKWVVDDFLKGWEVTASLIDRQDSLTFEFSSSIVTEQLSDKVQDRTTDLNESPSEMILLSDEVGFHVSHEKFPAPHMMFKLSPEVLMMYYRYNLYRQGHETLLGLAFWCLTVIEYSGRGKNEAADQYRVDLRVLRKLGELCSNRLDVIDNKKVKGNSTNIELKSSEREWLRAVVKRLILRVGEYAFDPNSRLPVITMTDFPSMQ